MTCWINCCYAVDVTQVSVYPRLLSASWQTLLTLSSPHCCGPQQEVNQPGSRPRPNTARASGVWRRVGGVHRAHGALCACYFLVKWKNRRCWIHRQACKLWNLRTYRHLHILEFTHRPMYRQACTCLRQTFSFYTLQTTLRAAVYT